MKRLLLIFAIVALTLGCTANAQSDSRFAYVKKSNVNIRDKASTSGSVVGKAQEGDVYFAGQNEGDWVPVCYDIFEEEWGYISKGMVDVVESYPFPADKLNSTFTVDEGDLIGYLTFAKKGDMVNYEYVLKSKAVAQGGGTGIVDSGSGEVNYDEANGMLYQPGSWFLSREDPSGISAAIFDPSTGKLIYGGILWTEAK